MIAFGRFGWVLLVLVHLALGVVAKEYGSDGLHIQQVEDSEFTPQNDFYDDDVHDRDKRDLLGGIVGGLLGPTFNPNLPPSSSTSAPEPGVGVGINVPPLLGATVGLDPLEICLSLLGIVVDCKPAAESPTRTPTPSPSPSPPPPPPPPPSSTPPPPPPSSPPPPPPPPSSSPPPPPPPPSSPPPPPPPSSTPSPPPSSTPPPPPPPSSTPSPLPSSTTPPPPPSSSPPPPPPSSSAPPPTPPSSSPPPPPNSTPSSPPVLSSSTTPTPSSLTPPSVIPPSSPPLSPASPPSSSPLSSVPAPVPSSSVPPASPASTPPLPLSPSPSPSPPPSPSSSASSLPLSSTIISSASNAPSSSASSSSSTSSVSAAQSSAALPPSPPGSGSGPSTNRTAALFLALQKSHFAAISWTTGLLTLLVLLLAAVSGILTFHAIQQASHTHGEDEGLVGGHEARLAAATPVEGAVPSFIAKLDPTTLLFHFQGISSFGLLSLNYPTIYEGFTLNFSFANFIIVPSKKFSTFVNSIQRRETIDDNLKEQLTGIEVYAMGLGIDPDNISTVVYFVFLGVCAIFSTLVILAWVLCQVGILRSGIHAEQRRRIWKERQVRAMHFASNNWLKLISLALGSLATFGFWQWTRTQRSPVRSILSATAFIAIIFSIITVTYLVVKISRRPGGLDQLFNPNSSYARRWGTVYDTLYHSSLYYVVPFSAVTLIRSAIVGFGQKSGLAQSVALTVLEITTFLVIFFFQPFYSLGLNRVNWMMKGCAVILSVIVIPFAHEVKLKDPHAQALGILLIVLQSILSLVLIILTILKLGWGVLWFKKGNPAFARSKPE